MYHSKSQELGSFLDANVVGIRRGSVLHSFPASRPIGREKHFSEIIKSRRLHRYERKKPQ